MNAPPDRSALLRALQADVPSQEEELRVRQRLIAAGILSSSSLVVVAASATATAGVPAKASAMTLGKVMAAAALAATLGGSLLLASLTDPRPSSTRTRASQPPAMSKVDDGANPTVPASAPDGQAADTPPASPTIRELRLEQGVKQRKRGPRAEKRAAARSANPSTLAAEGALLASALEAIQQGDLDNADRLLREHEQRFPDGMLRHECQIASKRLREAIARVAHTGRAVGTKKIP